MKKIKLLVVDDSILFREVLTRYIREDSQIDVVGTAGDPYSCLLYTSPSPRDA